jgi:hypothetical protein
MSAEKVTTKFFAVQKMPFEDKHEMAELVIKTAHNKGLLFTVLDVIDIIEVGSTEFVRFRSDLVDVATLVSALYEKKRAIITLEGTGYQAKMGSRTGAVPFTKMSVVPAGQFVSYRGTKVQHWDRQFIKEPEFQTLEEKE